MTSSTKQKVRNVSLHWQKKRTKTQLQATCTQILVKFGYVIFSSHLSGQTDKQTYYHNSLYPSQRQSNNKKYSLTCWFQRHRYEK